MSQMTKGWLIILAALLLVAVMLVLASCTAPTPTPTPTPTATPTSTPTPTATPTSTPTPTPTPTATPLGPTTLTFPAARGVIDTLKAANLTYKEIPLLSQTNGDEFVDALCLIANGSYAPYVELTDYTDDAVILYTIRETCKEHRNEGEATCMGCEPEHHLPYCGTLYQDSCIRRWDGKRLLMLRKVNDWIPALVAGAFSWRALPHSLRGLQDDCWGERHGRHKPENHP